MEFAEQLGGLAAGLVAADGPARAVMVVPASPGAGASTVARSLARLVCAEVGRPVWLFDLDFRRNPQSRVGRFRDQRFEAALGDARFWTAEPEGCGRLVFRRMEDLPVFVSRFERRPGAVKRVSMRSAPVYWDRVRKSCALALVDAPFGAAGVKSVAPDMDGVIVVADARDHPDLRAEAHAARLDRCGAPVLGVVINRETAAA
ncbi:hypothetical protein DDZ18_04755 [Marinicauda salina]|uniref:Sugar kinase n=1 Tax=Marinicauda salina TaxID=2135793 RepID=A0A2U2BV83_9PROT|nr:hypothetical protein [Marinicauda salina]PWE17889.1 hypothetical protein DDZ18_04755 [Marinicauda salina]